MNRKERRKKIILIIFLIIALAIAAIVAFLCWIQNEKSKVVDGAYMGETQDYSASKEIEEAKKKLSENPQKASVITDINTTGKEITICFEGSTDATVMEQILEMLKDHDMTATFFLSAVDASEDQDIIDDIFDADCGIESYTLYGTSHMEELSQDELVEDFCRANVVYEDKINKTPTFLKCNATDYTKELLEAADACGYESVVYPTVYLNYKSFSTEMMTDEYVQSLGYGRVISVKLSGYLDELEYEETKVDEDPAKDKQPDLELQDTEEEELTEQEQLLQVVDWLLTYLDQYEYETVDLHDLPAQDIGDISLQYEEVEAEYEDKLTEATKSVHTTDRECAFTFYGIGDEQELTNTLAALEETGASGTFFVSGSDITRYPEQIQQILDAGYELGSSGYSGRNMKNMSFGQICEEIYKNDLLLKEYGVETSLFMPPSGNVTEDIQKAASATGKEIILYNAAPARTEYAEAGYDAATVVKEYFSDARIVLCRGDIVYFNMNVYDDDTSIADLVKAVYKSKVQPTAYEGSVLKVVSVSDLMDHTWSYPAYTNASYHMIESQGKSLRTLDDALATHYIGTSWQTLSGFTDTELAVIDREGRINTGGTNTVFLTFDDWGNEATIGKLLYVLKKHNVKASFFIKTEYVEDGSSENLLRAIAEDGHDIGSHTNEHIPIDVDLTGVARLRSDLVQSNRTLSKIVGNTGALKNYFRPPTLAVNRTGVSTVYDCGYNWIVCGDVSTGDYNASSAEAVFDILTNGVINDDGSRTPIQDGSVVVMHINTNAKYTAKGLDMYLTWQESLPVGTPGKFNFAKLSNYLQ